MARSRDQGSKARRGESRNDGKGREATRRDVELAKSRLDLAKIHRSIELWSKAIQGVVGVLWIAAAAIPIYALQVVIEPIAGRTTVFDANVVISITLAVSIALHAGQVVKGRSQRSEIKRLRRRKSELEDELLN